MNTHVEAISPAVYPVNIDEGGEQATATTGEGDGGAISQAQGEVIEGPEEEIQAQVTLP